ncbi:MAG: hypothetical protein WC853_13365 [Thermodesulfovibrionales bacterium]
MVNVNGLIKTFIVFLIDISFASIIFASQFPSEYPSFIPPGFSKELKAKYRIIEHSSSRYLFYINDTNRIKITEDGITMYAPVYTQTYTREGWISEVVKETVHTATQKENIYLIEKGKPVQKTDYSKRIFVIGMNYPHVATDEESLDTYLKIKDASDFKMWKPIWLELYAKRKLFQVENNVKVKIMESRSDRVKVKILGGTHKGQIGWVISDWVK